MQYPPVLSDGFMTSTLSLWSATKSWPPARTSGLMLGCLLFSGAPRMAKRVAAIHADRAAGTGWFLGRFVLISVSLNTRSSYRVLPPSRSCSSTSSLSSSSSMTVSRPCCYLCLVQNSLHRIDLSHLNKDASTSVLLNFLGISQKFGPRFKNFD